MRLPITSDFFDRWLKSTSAARKATLALAIRDRCNQDKLSIVLKINMFGGYGIRVLFGGACAFMQVWVPLNTQLETNSSSGLLR
ncbi:MAG: hypothetical protein ACRD4Q_15250, partial [Candidatus Acidiferrales bacterium]